MDRQERSDFADVVKFVQCLDTSRLDICAYLEAIIPAGDDEEAQGAALLKLFPNPLDMLALIAWSAGVRGCRGKPESGQRPSSSRS